MLDNIRIIFYYRNEGDISKSDLGCIKKKFFNVLNNF